MRIPPLGSTWSGVYLDDLLVTQKIKRHHLARDKDQAPNASGGGRTSVVYPDTKIVEDICKGYEFAGFPRAVKKSFRDQLEFRAWGAEVDGRKGSGGCASSYAARGVASCWAYSGGQWGD